MQLINIDQLSQKLNVKIKTLYDWIHREQIPYIKMGRLVRFDLEEIEKWLKSKKHRTGSGRSTNGY